MDGPSINPTLNKATKRHFSFRQDNQSTFSISSHEPGGDTYIFSLYGRSNSTDPTIFLVRQRDGKVVLSATRSGLTSTFQIYAGDARTTGIDNSPKDLAPVTLQLDRPDSVWSLADAEGKEAKYAWMKASNVNVDGIGKITGLLRRNYKLVPRDRPDEVLAVFSSNQVSFTTGTIQLEASGVSMGDRFEHLALMTLACQNARNLQGTNVNPVGNLGALPTGGGG